MSSLLDHCVFWLHTKSYFMEDVYYDKYNNSKHETLFIRRCDIFGWGDAPGRIIPYKIHRNEKTRIAVYQKQFYWPLPSGKLQGIVLMQDNGTTSIVAIETFLK